MKGYCMKCRKMRDMLNMKYVTKNKRKFAVGKCKTCGTKIYKIVPKK